MFTFFVFRRFGLAVPLSLLLVGFVLQHIFDSKHGNGFYSSHFVPMGLTLFLSGVILGIISFAIIDSSSGGSGGNYSSLLSAVDFGDTVGEMKSDMQDKVQTYINDTSDDDMFCYIPLNRCSQVLIVAGIVCMVAGAFAD
jgi:hypothetical protein